METLYKEKQKPPYWTEMQNTEKQNTSDPSTTKQDKINVGLIKKIPTEKKSSLPSLMNQDK